MQLLVVVSVLQAEFQRENADVKRPRYLCGFQLTAE